MGGCGPLELWAVGRCGPKKAVEESSGPLRAVEACGSLILWALETVGRWRLWAVGGCGPLDQWAFGKCGPSLGFYQK